MFKTVVLIAFNVISSIAPPSAAPVEPRTDTGKIEACRILHQEDPSVATVQCLAFLETGQASGTTDWVPPFCRALAYYEPEMFFSIYGSIADCIAHNEDE